MFQWLKDAVCEETIKDVKHQRCTLASGIEQDNPLADFPEEYERSMKPAEDRGQRRTPSERAR
jgi:hypothetical protein